jgi:hypothetical protein
MKTPIQFLQVQQSSAKSTFQHQSIVIKLFAILLFVLFSISSNAKEELKRGIYYTYEDFKNNTPDTIDAFYVVKKERKRKNWKGTYSLTPRFAEGGKKIKHIWGFCDGEQAYIFHQKEFFPIEKTETNHVFFGYAQKRGSVKGGGAIIAGVEVAGSIPYFGFIIGAPIFLTGGIIAASTASSYKKDKIEYLINPRNGAIH